jgi:dipeptidyl aminopeptidase/acylaminoacyl peptidase
VKNRVLQSLFASAALAATFVGVTSSAHAQTAAATPAAKSDERFPVSVFVKRDNMGSAELSPDGSKLAYQINDNGKPAIAYLDLTKPNAKPVIVIAGEEAREAGDRTVGGYNWVGNNNLVVQISMRVDFGSGPGDISRLVSYDVSTAKITQLAWEGSGGGASDILYTDHEKAEILIERDTVNSSNERANLPQVLRVDVRTGKYKIVQNTNPEISSWFADGQGVVRAGFGGDGDTGKQSILYRTSEKDNFKTVLNAVDKSFTGGLPEPQLFLPNSDLAYAISRKDGFSKVYKMNMKTMELGAPVFETPGFDVQSILTNDDDTDVRGYVVFDGRMRAKYTDPFYIELKAAAEELFGKDVVSIQSVSKNHKKAILSVGGLKKNGGYYLYDLVTGKVSLLNWQSTALKDTPINPVAAEWYTARDGLKQQAIVTYPRLRKGKNLPVVIMPHGGPFGVISATNQNEPWSQPLAEAGYVVIQPNYRGSGGYGKQFEEEGRKPDGYGVKMQDDLTDLLNAYAEKGIVDKNRACIMGWSYGGYATARGAQRDPGIWKCAIAGAGIYDFPMMTKWDKEHLGKFSSGFQATSNDPKGISSALHTDTKWSPILIVAGLRDKRVPIEQARTLVSRLKSSGKVEGTDFKYIEQKQGTHNLPYNELHIQWIEEAEQWLARFNPAYVASDSDKAPALVTLK